MWWTIKIGVCSVVGRGVEILEHETFGVFIQFLRTTMMSEGQGDPEAGFGSHRKECGVQGSKPLGARARTNAGDHPRPLIFREEQSAPVYAARRLMLNVDGNFNRPLGIWPGPAFVALQSNPINHTLAAISPSRRSSVSAQSSCALETGEDT